MGLKHEKIALYMHKCNIFFISKKFFLFSKILIQDLCMGNIFFHQDLYAFFVQKYQVIYFFTSIGELIEISQFFSNYFLSIFCHVSVTWKWIFSYCMHLTKKFYNLPSLAMNVISCNGWPISVSLHYTFYLKKIRLTKKNFISASWDISIYTTEKMC